MHFIASAMAGVWWTTLPAPGGAKKIAGGNMANFQALAEEFALRAFPYTRRSQ